MELIQLDDFRWEIEKQGPMRVPARIYSSADMIETIKKKRHLNNWSMWPSSPES